MKKTLRYLRGQTLVRRNQNLKRIKHFLSFPMILTFGSFYCKLSQTHFTYWKSSDTSALLSFDAISHGFLLHLCKEKIKIWPTIILCRQTLKMLLLSCQQSAVTKAPKKNLGGYFHEQGSKKSSLQNMS